MLQRAQLVEDAAKRPDVTLVVVWLVLAYLRREVVWGADCRLREVLCVLQHLGNAKVPKLNHPFLRHKDVLALGRWVSVRYGMVWYGMV